MLTEIVTYAERAKARILAQYQTKPLFVALIAELATLVQEIEAALFDVTEQTAIGVAFGTWLDRLGAIVGEERGGVGDVLFRRYILARIQANTSEGTLEDVIAVITAWYGAAFPSLILTEPGRANLLVDLNSPDVQLDALARLVKLLRDTRSAGVGGQMLYQLQASTKIFQFSSDATLQLDTQKGFGDSTNPLTGGSFRGVTIF